MVFWYDSQNHDLSTDRRKKDFCYKPLPVAALGVGLLFAAVGSAHGQSAEAPQADPAAVQDNSSGSGSLPQSEIVVTGSRIQNSGFTAPTPLTVLNVQDIQRDAPVNVADFVNKLPQFSSSTTTANTGNSIGDGSAGVNNLNLRGVGANRTLILLDGNRVVPSSIAGYFNNGGAVDINPFPEGLIKRVDIVTAGASAAYGSDAVAGVVNFVLDKTYTGIKGDAMLGLSDYGDDFTNRLSLTAGMPFAGGRGHFLLSGTYVKNNGVLTNEKRSWLADHNWNQINNPAYSATNGQPFFLILDQVGSSRYTPGGLIASGPLRGIDFGPGGSTRMFNYGPINDGNKMSGGDWMETKNTTNFVVGPTVSINPRVKRQNIFSRVSFDLTDDIQIYGQFMFAHTTTLSNSNSAYQTNFVINADNPFIPASVRTRMNALGLTSFTMSKELGGDLGVIQTSTSRNFFQYLGGVQGTTTLLGTEWSWDAGLSRSTSRAKVYASNNPIKSRFAQAINVVTSPITGAPICRSTLTNPNDGCIPFNAMGTGVNSPAALSYISGTSRLDQTLAQNEMLFNVSGSPFETWAGPVSIALGVEHRKVSVRGESSPLDEAADFQTGNFRATFGAQKATEGYAEVILPLAKDVSWAKELSLNGAVRRTNYSTSGSVTTWKIGGTYEPMSGILLRATRSRDIRAPNLGELFNRGAVGTSTVRDPERNNLNVPMLTVRRGNPTVGPEIGDTLTFGAAVRPAFVPGLSFSVDYFKLKMKDVLITRAQQDIVDACFAGDQQLCSLVTRDAARNITEVILTPINTAFLKTDGIDAEFAYTRPVADFIGGLDGSITLRGLVSHRFNLTYQDSSLRVVEGAGVNMGAPISTPSWTYNASITYDSERFSTTLTGRGFGSGVYSNEYIECTTTCPTSTLAHQTINESHLPGKFYMDANFTYHLDVGTEHPVDLYLTVNNVTKNNPGGIAFYGFTTGSYDFQGRVFRTGVRFSF